MKLNKYHKIISNTPDDVKEHIRLSMDIMDRIHELLDKKFEGKQKLFAEKMGKSEAEISGWLSGVQNFTTKTLAKLSCAFGEPIIAVCTDEQDSATFQRVKIPFNGTKTILSIDCSGTLKRSEVSYHKINPTHKKVETTLI